MTLPKNLFFYCLQMKEFLTLVRIARRDLRSGLSTLLISSICITLSVFLVVFISSISQSIMSGLKGQGRSILGGDVAFTTVHRDLGETEKRWLLERGEISSIALTRTMGRSNEGRSTLVEIKAVDKKYPLLGKFKSSPSGSLEEVSSLGEKFGAIVERDLLSRLGLRVGDLLQLGDHRFKIFSVIDDEPDSLSNGIAFGPRAIISLEAARESGLVQDGSLTRWVTRVSLFNSIKLDDLISEFRLQFPDSSWQSRTHNDSVPALNRALERFRIFLTASCVLVLLVGGIGVSNSVRLFVKRRSLDFATLKALGARDRFVLFLSFGEVATIAFVCASLGALLGSSSAYLGASTIGGVFHVPLEAKFFTSEIFAGLATGFFGALSFSIAPLARAQSVPTRDVLGRLPVDLDAAIPVRYWIFIFAGFFITTLFAAQMLNYSSIGVLMLIGAIVCVILLGLVGDTIRRVIQTIPRPKTVIARFVFLNITGPGHLTRSIVVTFGLGMAALSSIFTLENNIRAQFSNAISTKSPDLFLIDIPVRVGDRVTDIIKKHAARADVEMTPMMRGRLVRINGAAVSNKNISESVAWVLDGDRGITFSSSLPKNSRIVEGEWWSPSYAGEPLVSIDADIAKGLSVGVGDFLTLSVMGREITARISSLRRLEWSSLGLNFVFVFSPNTFLGAPFMQTAAVRLHADQDVQKDLIQDLSQQLPSLVAIQVRETFEKLSLFIGQLQSIVISLTLILFGLAVLVLASALAANQEARIYSAAVFVALGASRRTLLFAFALEFILLGLIAAVIGVSLGAGASWLLLHRLIQPGEFLLPIATFSLAALVVVIVISLMGLAITKRELAKRLGARLKQSQ